MAHVITCAVLGSAGFYQIRISPFCFSLVLYKYCSHLSCPHCSVTKSHCGFNAAFHHSSISLLKLPPGSLRSSEQQTSLMIKDLINFWVMRG